MSALVLSCVVFMAIHAIPATRMRAALISLVGLPIYLALFSLASIAFLVMMGLAYSQAPPQPVLWLAGTPLRITIAVAMIAPFWLAVAGVTEPNPAAVGGGSVLARSAAPHGVFTITRHPLMVAIALWACLHIIANPDLSSIVLFASLAATALFGARLQDRRKESEIGTAWRRYLAQTSYVPFRAIIENRTRLDLEGMRWWRTVLALVLWAVVLNTHGYIVGVPALAF